MAEVVDFAEAFKDATPEQLSAGRRKFMLLGISSFLSPLRGMDDLDDSVEDIHGILVRNQIRLDTRAALKDYIVDHPLADATEKLQAGMYLLGVHCRQVCETDPSFQFELIAIENFARLTHHEEFDANLAQETWEAVSLDD